MPPEAEDSENLLREAMRNSGIVIERVSMEEDSKSDEVDATEQLESEETEAPEKLCPEHYVELEQVEETPVSCFRAPIFPVL